MKSILRVAGAAACLGLLFGCSASQVSENPEIDVLNQQYEDLQKTPEGADYEELAVQEFFERNFSAVQLCAPPDAPLARPFSIFLSVGPEGQVASMTFEPETDVTRCLLKNVIPVKFTKPSAKLPSRIVVRIDMVFEE